MKNEYAKLGFVDIWSVIGAVITNVAMAAGAAIAPVAIAALPTVAAAALPSLLNNLFPSAGSGGQYGAVQADTLGYPTSELFAQQTQIAQILQAEVEKQKQLREQAEKAAKEAEEAEKRQKLFTYVAIGGIGLLITMYLLKKK